jgi:hypothetical protein
MDAVEGADDMNEMFQVFSLILKKREKILISGFRTSAVCRFTDQTCGSLLENKDIPMATALLLESRAVGLTQAGYVRPSGQFQALGRNLSGSRRISDRFRLRRNEGPHSNRPVCLKNSAVSVCLYLGLRFAPANKTSWL